jgi:hypothetical protein
VLSGLNQIQNGFQNLSENGFENFEKKKKRDFLLFSVFGPFPSATRRLGLPAAARLLPQLAWPASLLPRPASSLWAEPSQRLPAQLHRACAAPSPESPTFRPH